MHCFIRTMFLYCCHVRIMMTLVVVLSGKWLFTVAFSEPWLCCHVLYMIISVVLLSCSDDGFVLFSCPNHRIVRLYCFVRTMTLVFLSCPDYDFYIAVFSGRWLVVLLYPNYDLVLLSGIRLCTVVLFYQDYDFVLCQLITLPPIGF